MDQPYAPNPHTKPKHHWKLYLFLIFAGILSFLIYSAYNPSGFAGKITGNVIRGSSSFEDGSQVLAELRASEEFEINSKIGKVNLRINGPVSFYTGKQKIDIADGDQFMSISRFIPDFKNQAGTVDMTIKTRPYPTGTQTSHG